MKVMVTGACGQLATELKRTVPAEVRLESLSIDQLCVTDRLEVLQVVEKADPDVVINAAAYTAVDKAEEEEPLATRINGDGPRHLAEAVAGTQSRLVHVSTDFVFDGTLSRPYRTDDATNPISAYGRSKLAGELAVRQVLGSEALVVRSSWVYASHGKNFLGTMLRLMSERGRVGVVADQVGSPTWARTLASGIWNLVLQEASGTHHLTDAGVASWFDFAVAIRELGVARGLLDETVVVDPIRTVDYPTPAARPSYGVMDKTDTFNLLGGSTPHWRSALACCMDELKS
ncbi:MAG: dTDP-4-dehydrorhamnose reductase [Phycisphaerales bacterium]|nr:dTDP-4-dehydrorhamnose reductase [Phycisphaerales bacterium]